MPESEAWRTFLPITAETVGPVDAAAATRADLLVLRLIRRRVLPLVRKLQRDHGLAAFHFLVHDHASGVPCPIEDKGAYVDLNLWFRTPVTLCTIGERVGLAIEHGLITELLAPAWLFTASRPRVPTGMAGVNVLDFERAEALLNEQSDWYLRLIESFAPEIDDATVLRHVQQFLHFFANMTQMMVK